MPKCLVIILMDFPLYYAALFGLVSYNDTCFHNNKRSCFCNSTVLCIRCIHLLVVELLTRLPLAQA